MIAHIRTVDGKKQDLKEHLNNVSDLCRRYAVTFQLAELAGLIGIMHDMGKATEAFSEYLKRSVDAERNDDNTIIQHQNHAPTGAIYAYERWYCDGDKTKKLTAQIIALCIYGHHSGLMDCVDDSHNDCFFKNMKQDKEKLNYIEAKQYFVENIMSEEDMDLMFNRACCEINLINTKIKSGGGNKQFQKGLIVRILLSVLVDADRWDSACFEYDEDSLKEKISVPEWSKLSGLYDSYSSRTFTGTGKMDQIRKNISDICAAGADNQTGIYRLTVPTGGGKTFSSLRYALKHAEKNRLNRIFYIIPFNTILDQNAKDIREALMPYDGILEHHSGMLFEDESEKEQNQYKRLTERWDSRIILTSIVQFLNAFYRKENTNARRMHNLSNSVLIFDEIQALPRRCKTLFEQAVIFLTKCCHSTVLLCSATQIELNLPEKPVELMGDDEKLIQLNDSLKRVRYFSEIETPLENNVAAQKLAGLVQEQGSVLLIANTKAAAWEIFEKACENLSELNYSKVIIEANLSDEDIADRVKNAGDREILCVYLSTLLCAAHRKEYLRWIKLWNKKGGRVLCVSTALIEAGINVSFPVVVRALAGLPSIVQAAGRCNRNKEQECGSVYIWNLVDKGILMLPEISNGKEISRTILFARNENPDSISNPECIKLYFQQEILQYDKEYETYPIGRKGSGKTMLSLLSSNTKNVTRGKNYQSELKQSFREAGENFQVIDNLTRTVVVPYGEGKKLIESLNGEHGLQEEVALLRKAQQYSVNLYDNMYRRLSNEGAIYPVGSNGVIVLSDEYYDLENGVKAEANEMEFISF